MNAYWQAEMRANAAREHALMSGPGGDFYRRWKMNGSPNSVNQRTDLPARAITPPRRPFPVGVRKVAKPKMNDHAGRTWDRCDVYLPDGRKIVGFLDTTWGTRFYFQPDGWGGDWYAASIDNFDTHDRMSNIFCLREDRYGVRIGDTVELKESAGAGQAEIIGFYAHEGGVLIKPELDGFRSWNVSDLNVVKRGRRG